ncbi:hypothetical protein FQA39_LY18863 [Lamprigera yunnana]|nr:hypothetical protein FQA39_LY18863 [Lamprigera yunnana]
MRGNSFPKNLSAKLNQNAKESAVEGADSGATPELNEDDFPILEILRKRQTFPPLRKALLPSKKSVNYDMDSDGDMGHAFVDG